MTTTEGSKIVPGISKYMTEAEAAKLSQDANRGRARLQGINNDHEGARAKGAGPTTLDPDWPSRFDKSGRGRVYQMPSGQIFYSAAEDLITKGLIAGHAFADHESLLIEPNDESDRLRTYDLDPLSPHNVARGVSIGGVSNKEFAPREFDAVLDSPGELTEDEMLAFMEAARDRRVNKFRDPGRGIS